MFAILNVIAPIFALMALGYGAVRFKFYPQDGIKALIAFVNNFATPCLLFRSILTGDFRAAFNIGIIGPFYLGAFACFIIAIFIGLKLFRNTPGEAVSAGFAATFSNTVLIGLPIMQRAYGDAAIPIVLSIIGIHGAVLMTTAMMTMEMARRDGSPLGPAILGALKRIGTNPLIWGIAAGIISVFAGVTLIEPVDAFLRIISQAVVPVALFGIGGALNEYRLSESWAQALVASIIKLMVHPTIAYILMVPILHIDISIARYGIVLAAMPAGINTYVFATYYNRGVNIAANAVLIGTIASAITVSFWLFVFSP
ncbi:AEC family transporter [Devosia rhodophyticola]|uniref:AEC family transporter n=1 Tax=Devosia rhodophyticola TaxID=3026423 RepID=A0ABY7YZ67_9HYPH|nr:AEC family transporter [Devosia rhodophyticola]WDR06075.1 AEC family transporter [Devosia rhodophyticola]